MQQMFLLQILLLAQHVLGTIMPMTTGGNQLYNTLKLLMMLHLVGILFPHINDDARSKSLQSYIYI
jgi:hypothetical protein